MKLARREKQIVSVAACILAVFFVLQFLVFPFFHKKDRMERGIRAKEKGLKEIVMLNAEYHAYQGSSRRVEQILAKRQQGFTLFSFLERAAGETKVKKHIKYMKPSESKGKGSFKESMIEMKLERISLQQLVNFLYRIESPENIINIKRISIKENKGEPGSLDAILQVLALTLETDAGQT